jgi:N6-L-threonylcarbamoyladenine synthase
LLFLAALSNIMPITILAIESSCDETAAAVIRGGDDAVKSVKILSNVIASQQEHEKYGGVVPELASRQHVQHIIPVVTEALGKASVTKDDLSAVAFTAGPGLIGSLMVGSAFAKAIALALSVPLLAVHHMQAHIHAHFIEEGKPGFPFLCLTVSGGHTQIVLVKDYLEMEIIGETLDDAAGEAFDKTAKMLGIPYPGGPMIDAYAQDGNPDAYQFPEPQIDDLNFSFSGLKTSILYFLKEKILHDPYFIEKNLHDVCASVQHRIVTILLKKLEKAARDYQIHTLALAGGVSANSSLRKEVQKLCDLHGWKVFIPPLAYCTDNAAMIASVAYHQFLAGKFAGMDIAPAARMEWPISISS